MTRETKKIIRYSISFKQQVVQEVEQGMGIQAVSRKYNITGGNTIQKWITLFGKNHLLNKIVRIEMKGEKDRIKELEAQNRKLKMALADATLEKDALQQLIEIVDVNYQTDVKKNLGSQLFSGPTGTTGTP